MDLAQKLATTGVILMVVAFVSGCGWEPRGSTTPKVIVITSLTVAGLGLVIAAVWSA